MAGSVGVYTQCEFPWVAVKSTTGFARTNDSAALGMGYWESSLSQNDEWTIPRYLDSVTWKFAMNHTTNTNRGIATVKFDGTTLGTIDTYAAVGATAYSEITGISITTAKAADFQVIQATKNAASSGYRLTVMSAGMIRTGGTPSTPAGTDTPGYTVEAIWWMGNKSDTGFATRTQLSDRFAGGRLESDGTQSREVNRDNWIDAGTFTYVDLSDRNITFGIASHRLDGVEKVSIDEYAAAASANAVTTTASIANATAGVKSWAIVMATKNASSSSYVAGQISDKWLRTGA